MKQEQELYKIEITPVEAVQFRLFQKNHFVIAPIVGFMDSLHLNDLRGCKLNFDINPDTGVIEHVSITKHYR